MATVATITNTSEDVAIPLVASRGEFELPRVQESARRLVPIDHGPQSKVDFGAEVYGIDLNNFTDEDFAFISDALHRHKVLVFKEQPALLDPRQQYKLTARFVQCYVLSLLKSPTARCHETRLTGL